MDAEYRKKAKEVCSEVKNSLQYRHNKESAIPDFLMGTSIYEKIVQKIDEDYAAISEAYVQIATIYFNIHSYEKAAEYYLNAINQLLQTVLNDARYRELTNQYINLADACYELTNKPAGDDAMANAIKAFSLIKEKSKEEQELGDPRVNFIAFHNYFEKKLSMDSYLKSSKYTNHQAIQAHTQVAKYEENLLFNEFNNISIDEKSQLDKNISDMLNILSVAVTPPQTFFSPVVINNTTANDDNCRIMATELLKVSQGQFQQGLLSKTLATNSQIMEILSQIKERKEKDLQTMQLLQGQILFLETKLNTNRNTTLAFASSSSYQMGQSSTFFSSPSNKSNIMNTLNLNLMDDDTNDDGMCM